MKHLKSSFHDLHRIFEQSITVRDIAEPLASFDREYLAIRALEFMNSKGFDVVGVRSDGEVGGYVLKEDLKSGTVGEHQKALNDDEILREGDPLLHALKALTTRRWALVGFLGNPGGIVTRGDLQKAPMRMWLFGLISLLEMQMLRSIRAVHDEDDCCSKHLSVPRRAETQRIFDLRREKNEEISLSDCLQLADKTTIFKKVDSLFALTGLNSKRDWKDFMGKVGTLRNNLAHSNDLGTKTWPETANLAIMIEDVLKKLETAST